MDEREGIIRSATRGVAGTLAACALLASPVASAGVIATAEADVTITLTAARLNGSDVDITDLDFELLFTSTETETLGGQASGSAQATSTLSAADPGHLVIDDSLRVQASASGQAENGGSFFLESDGEWALRITNNDSIARSVSVILDLAFSLVRDIVLDNPQPPPSTGGGGLPPIGTGGNVGPGGGTGASGSSDEFDRGSATTDVGGDNVSGTGGGSSAPANTRQVIFNVVNLAAGDTLTMDPAEPVLVRVTGTAAVTAVPEAPALWLMLGAAPLVLLRSRSRSTRSGPWPPSANGAGGSRRSASARHCTAGGGSRAG